MKVVLLDGSQTNDKTETIYLYTALRSPEKAQALLDAVVACLFCHVNLDSRQKQIEEQFEETLGLPVLLSHS